jgi:hypothetical protein
MAETFAMKGFPALFPDNSKSLDKLETRIHLMPYRLSASKYYHLIKLPT